MNITFTLYPRKSSLSFQFQHIKSIHYFTWVTAQDLNSSTILSQHINLNNFQTNQYSLDLWQTRNKTNIAYFTFIRIVACTLLLYVFKTLIVTSLNKTCISLYVSHFSSCNRQSHLEHYQIKGSIVHYFQHIV